MRPNSATTFLISAPVRIAGTETRSAEIVSRDADCCALDAPGRDFEGERFRCDGDNATRTENEFMNTPKEVERIAIDAIAALAGTVRWRQLH